MQGDPALLKCCCPTVRLSKFLRPLTGFCGGNIITDQLVRKFRKEGLGTHVLSYSSG